MHSLALTRLAMPYWAVCGLCRDSTVSGSSGLRLVFGFPLQKKSSLAKGTLCDNTVKGKMSFKSLGRGAIRVKAVGKVAINAG